MLMVEMNLYLKLCAQLLHEGDSSSIMNETDAAMVQSRMNLDLPYLDQTNNFTT